MDFVSSTQTSVYLADPNLRRRPNINSLEEVGDGLSFETHTHLLETFYQLSNKIQLQYSHRIDWPDISSTMYSPRVSLISELSKNDTLRFTAQRSLRMMPLRAQYLYDKYNSSSGNSQHESLNSIELAFTKIFNDAALIDIHAYHNDIDAVGYTGTDLQFLGNIKLAGLDFELKLQLGDTDIILNHAYLKLLDMKMNPNLKNGSNRNNISFSDYYYNTTKGIPVLMESYGDSLNNWSDNSTRFLITHRFFEGRLTAHANAQIFWNQDGSYDEIHMYQRGYNNFDRSTLSANELIEFNEQESIFNRERILLEKQDAYDLDVTLNASLSYSWKTHALERIDTTLYIDNILESGKRYYISTGSNNIYPERLSFMEKERTIGLRVRIDFKN